MVKDRLQYLCDVGSGFMCAHVQMAIRVVELSGSNPKVRHAHNFGCLGGSWLSYPAHPHLCMASVYAMCVSLRLCTVYEHWYIVATEFEQICQDWRVATQVEADKHMTRHMNWLGDCHSAASWSC